VSHNFGMVIESLVAILLLVTIGYCVVLNSRLKRLRADEMSLKATISELITATEMAERAVGGLRATAHECDHTLGERLKTAERFCADLSKQITAGDILISRLSRIVVAARPSLEAMPEPQPEAKPAPAPAEVRPPNARSLVAAAQDFAQRASARARAA
jgi:uncharacterized protein DUF6468